MTASARNGRRQIAAAYAEETHVRAVKTYPIQEHELYALDDLGRNSTLWTAISAGAFALLASCVWSMIQLQSPAGEQSLNT